MDWEMPVMGGLDAIRLLKSQPETEDTPVVMLTAIEGSGFNVQVALDAGAIDFVHKPVDSVELTARVRSALRMSLATRALRESNDELVRVNGELRSALDEVRTLSGLLPICCHCKEVRNDKGYWSDLETFLHARVRTQFSHGICPPCLEKHYPDSLFESDDEGAEGVA